MIQFDVMLGLMLRECEIPAHHRDKACGCFPQKKSCIGNAICTCCCIQCMLEPNNDGVANGSLMVWTCQITREALFGPRIHFAAPLMTELNTIGEIRSLGIIVACKLFMWSGRSQCSEQVTWPLLYSQLCLFPESPKASMHVVMPNIEWVLIPETIWW
jgi:hypothetical protein